MKLLITLIITVSLSGCMTPAEHRQMREEHKVEQALAKSAKKREQLKLNEAMNKHPTCDTPQTCKAMWDAAQLWVTDHADMNIQIANNVIIRTYNPPRSSLYLAAEVKKRPAGNGKYQLEVKTWCNNPFGCTKNPTQAVIHFNNTVGAGGLAENQ